MGMEISGLVASLRWGYTQAATLASWKVSREGDRWRLKAAIDSVDTFRVSQRPLVFEASHAKGAWRWPVLELQVADGSLTATLGPHEG